LCFPFSCWLHCLARPLSVIHPAVFSRLDRAAQIAAWQSCAHKRAPSPETKRAGDWCCLADFQDRDVLTLHLLLKWLILRSKGEDDGATKPPTASVRPPPRPAVRAAAPQPIMDEERRRERAETADKLTAFLKQKYGTDNQ
jgi:hypothetical protein